MLYDGYDKLKPFVDGCMDCHIGCTMNAETRGRSGPLSLSVVPERHANVESVVRRSQANVRLLHSKLYTVIDG